MKDKIYIKNRFAFLIALLLCCIYQVSYAGENDSIQVRKSGDKLIDLAYGKQKERAVVGSVSTIWSDDLMKSTVTTVGNALYGKLPGLSVFQGSGEPGADVPSYLLRGVSTYAGSFTPLIIVDGFERSFDQLTLEEIESISVLKDAAATAMYGIRGANSVILVTTKRGVIGKNKSELTFQYVLQEPTRLPDFINSCDYARLMNEALVNDGKSELYSNDDLQKYQDGSDPYFHPDVNWFNEILRNSTPVWETGMNFTGGTKIVRHYVMVNFLHNQGLFKNTGWNDGYSTNSEFKRLNFRSNIDINVTKRLYASLDIGGRLEDRNAPGTAISTIFSNIYAYAPNLFPARNPNGSFGGTSAYMGNPLALVTSTGYTSSNDRSFQSAFRLEYDLDFITRGLKAGAVIAFDNWQRSSESFVRQFPVYDIDKDADGNITYQKFGQVTSLTRTTGLSHSYRTNFEAYLDYSRSFGLHELSAKALYHQDRYEVDWDVNNNRPYLMMGGSGRIHYGYNNKYIAEFVFGYNGTERFPEGNRFGFFPAVAASWIVSEENFLKGSSWLNDLKLNASYGLTGNDDIGAGGDRNLYTYYFINSGAYYFGSSNKSATATKESNYPNYNIGWEKSYKTDISVFGRFLNSLDITLDYFHEKRTDIVDNSVIALPSIWGISGGYVNYGIVNNHGVELALLLKRKIGDWSYSLGANASYVKTEIKKKYEPAYPNEYQYKTGHRLDQIFGLEAVGFFRDQAEIDDPQTPFHTFTPVTPGDVRYKDQDGNGRIDANDEVAIGKGFYPNLNYGFNLGLEFKGISLDASFQGIEGRDIMVTSLAGPMGQKAQISDFVMNRWTSDTKETATLPKLTTNTNNNNYRSSTLWLRSADFIRLRSVQLAYNLPGKTLSPLHLSNVKVFIRGMNLLTFDDLKKLDPETLTGYPALRSYSAGFYVQF